MSEIGYVHRMVWWAAHGGTLIPAGKCVCHSCDNPGCVNPDHLFLGTRSDNMRDMVGKGRHGGPPPQRGRQNPSAKLDYNKAVEIRRMCREGATQREAASAFGVAQATVSKVMRGLTW